MMAQANGKAPNPWLTIPWEDYEGHMAHPTVGQTQFLSNVFRQALHQFQPESIAVFGCATGNGFEHIDPDVCSRVTAVDINPGYLDILQDRFQPTIPGLECICEDVVTCDLKIGAYDLVHCALIFEYLEPRILIEKIRIWLRVGGILVVVLQLPSAKVGNVSPTEFRSLERLNPIMKLVDPEYLKKVLEESGFGEIRAFRETLPSAKEFFIGHYRKRSF